MSKRRQQRTPAFLGQALLILLPMLVLLCTGVYILRRDRSLAIEEARTRATELLDRLSPVYGSLLSKELKESATQARPWLASRSAAPNTNDPTDAPAGPFVKEFSLREWRGLTAPMAPVPPDWLVELTVDQTKSWAALEMTIQGTNTDAVDTAWATFQKVITDQHAQVNGRWLQLQWKSRHQADATTVADLLALAGLSKGVRSPSGIPLSTLVLMEVLKHPAAGSELSEELWSRLIEEVAENDGPLIPVLLEELNRMTRGKPGMDSRTAALREARSFAQSCEDLLEKLRATVLKDFDRGGRTNLWIDWHANPTLISASVVASEGTNRPVVRIECFPKAAISRAAAVALTASNIELPDFLGLGIEIQGVSVLAGAAPGSVKPLVSRGALVSDWGDEIRLRLQMQLKDESRLVEALDQRQRLFGGLLIISFLTACAGLIAARRTAIQQHRLGQLKDNFVSSVSHELRAPIASIRLMAESLETERVKDPERQKEYFRLMSQECRRLSGMISNVLDFSRIQQGRKEYHFEPTDIMALVRDTCLIMQPNAAERKVRLELRVPDSCEGTPVVDGQAVQQALINLVENAIKHSPAGEVVTIGLDVPSSPHPHTAGLRIWVEDHGPGIPAVEHERIFERFYRLGSELRRETPGVGIGLSIVKHIAEAHGGKVTVQSAPGQGSRFTLELPGRHPGN